MKELTHTELKETVKNFSSGWMRVNEGESAKFKVVSKTIYEIPDGEEGLDGSTMEYERWQCKVEDRDGIMKILTVQQRLAKAMLICLEDENLDWDKKFEGSEWYVERIDQWNWKVELLDWIGREDLSGTKSKKETPKEKPKETKSDDKVRLGLSDNARIAYDLITNNELNKKDMTYDSLKTVISSLTDLNLNDATEGVQEMMQKKLIKIVDDNVEWLM